MRDVDGLYGAERRKRFVEFFRIADNQHCELIAVDILCGNAIHVRSIYFLNLGRILVEPVGGIAVELVGHALGENLIRRIEAEDECVEDGVFRVLDFLRR